MWKRNASSHRARTRHVLGTIHELHNSPVHVILSQDGIQESWMADIRGSKASARADLFELQWVRLEVVDSERTEFNLGLI